jgi:hypothetical protein
LAPKYVIFPFDASTFQFPERAYCASAVLLLLLTIRELILPVALKFPVGFLRKRIGLGSVSAALVGLVIALL